MSGPNRATTDINDDNSGCCVGLRLFPHGNSSTSSSPSSLVGIRDFIRRTFGKNQKDQIVVTSELSNPDDGVLTENLSHVAAGGTQEYH